MKCSGISIQAVAFEGFRVKIQEAKQGISLTLNPKPNGFHAETAGFNRLCFNCMLNSKNQPSPQSWELRKIRRYLELEEDDEVLIHNCKRVIMQTPI